MEQADPKGGCAGTFMNLLQDERFNHQSEVDTGVLEEECGRLLSRLFSRSSEKKERGKAKKTTAIVRINTEIDKG